MIMTEAEEEKVELHMTEEEISVTEKYEADLVQKIDEAITAETLVGDWRKTARVIAYAMRACPEVPISYFLERLINLVKSEQIEHQGNLRLIRFSEVRRPIR